MIDQVMLCYLSIKYYLLINIYLAKICELLKKLILVPSFLFDE